MLPDKRPSLPTATLFRQILAVLGAVGAVGVGAELALIGHWHGAIQLVAFGSVALVVASGVTALLAPNRTALLGVRVVSVPIGIAGVVGAYEHVAKNRAFAAELHGDWSWLHLWWAGLNGRIPGLAPLVLAQLAVLVACSTIGHPALDRVDDPDDTARDAEAHVRVAPMATITEWATSLATAIGVVSGRVLVVGAALLTVEWRLAAVAFVSLPLLNTTTAERVGWVATVVVAALGGARNQAGLLGFGGLLAAVILTRFLFTVIGDQIDAVTGEAADEGRIQVDPDWRPTV